MAFTANIVASWYELPGDAIPLADLEMPGSLREQLPKIGQEFTFASTGDSTGLVVAAAKQALAAATIDPGSIKYVISAPTLITSYGFEIPALAVKNELGLNNADCINIAQGCSGILVAMKIAESLLRKESEPAYVLVVSACRASTLTENFTHGAFFWADAGAAILLKSGEGPGLNVKGYAESSSDRDWGAMRLRFGDASAFDQCIPADDLHIVVDFADQRAQTDYIAGEVERCGAVMRNLMSANSLEPAMIDSVFLPSIGRNRVQLLLEEFPELMNKMASDFRYAHMGGIDLPFFIDRHLAENTPADGAWFPAATPSYTAQRGGIILQYRDAD